MVELKVNLNLELVLQAVDRLKITETVYIAFPETSTVWRRHWRRARDLARRLGIGLMTVTKRGVVKVRLDPTPYRPRGSATRTNRLLLEFEHRVGDSNVGGTTRVPLMTAYRQDALRCAAAIRSNSPLKLAEMRTTTGVENAAAICQRNVYGWFERAERGAYELSPKGRRALKTYADVLAELNGARGANT